MAVIRNVPVDGAAADQLARRVFELLRTSGQKKATAEVALIIAYANVADGVAEYPAATKALRASLFVNRAMTALCKTIEEVAAIPDDEVAVAALAVGGSTTTH